ncbi:COG1361 S-layer family protein [Halobacterium salinarum]|uniref:COG1361 S-layer family protein n=1 Tax=Halobacterium sp. (strain GN101) TaxID=88773 RepID=UPI0020FFFB63|nr:COG1361 S-layer family protein [Halobacterium sp. GN101]MCF2208303.1 COG1361 S-layer family protein [Halobacterium salinarum]MCF2240652.1 COG1361 S-layer family protein [Halobacterium salinarum]
MKRVHNTSRRAAIGVFVVVLLVGPGIPAVAAQASDSGQVIGNPDLNVLTSSGEFEAGTTTELQLTVSNKGHLKKGGPSQYEDRVTTARGLTLDVQDDTIPIDVTTGTIGVGRVPTGTTSVTPVSVTVPEDVDPGTYRVPIEYSYAYTRAVNYNTKGAQYNDFTETGTQYITIQVRDQAQFEVVDRSTTAQVGSGGDLSVTVENIGTETAREASVTAASRSDALSVGTKSTQSTAQVGSWEPGEQRTLNYTVSLDDDAATRAYTADLTVDYTDPDGIAQTSRTLSVGVDPRAEQQFSVANVSTNLRVGREGSVQGSVVNDGPNPVTNPVVRIAAQNPNIHVDSTAYAVPDLGPGERAPFEYTVSVSDAASASVQQLNLTVKYRDQRGDVRYSDGLETNADIKPYQDRFAVAVENNTLQAGGERALTVTVTNNGDDPITDVEAKAFVDDPLGSDNDEGIVSELAPGASETITISLDTGGSTLPKRYPVSIEFQYELPDGDTETSRSYTLPIEVTASDGGGLPVGLIAGGIVVVGVVGVVGWRRRSQD